MASPSWVMGREILECVRTQMAMMEVDAGGKEVYLKFELKEGEEEEEAEENEEVVEVEVEAVSALRQPVASV